MGGFHFFTKFLQIIVNRRATFVLAEQMQYIYISTLGVLFNKITRFVCRF